MFYYWKWFDFFLSFRVNKYCLLQNFFPLIVLLNNYNKGVFQYIFTMLTCLVLIKWINFLQRSCLATEDSIRFSSRGDCFLWGELSEWRTVQKSCHQQCVFMQVSELKKNTCLSSTTVCFGDIKFANFLRVKLLSNFVGVLE